MELKGNYLTVDFMNEFQEELQKFWVTLYQNGYLILPITTKNVSIDFPPTEIQSLFNLQESNMEVIDSAADWVNPYYNYYKWEKANGAIFSQINRWINWLNFNLKIVNGEIEKSQFLEDENKSIITDINGEKILTFEGYF